MEIPTRFLSLFVAVVASVIADAASTAAQGEGAKATQPLVTWLKDYIPAKYPAVEFIDHGDWFQSRITDLDLVVSWAELPQPSLALKEVQGLDEGEGMFINKVAKDRWADLPGVEFHEGAGFYIRGYNSATMGDWEVGKLTVAQLRGDSKKFVEEMAKARVAALRPFRQWLFEYIPAHYPEARMTDHTYWLQAHIAGGVIASWTQWNDEDVTLKEVEAHNLTDGKAFFLDKAVRTEWVDHPAVTFFEGAGYYCSGYDSATMSEWKVETLNVVQLDGDAKKFVKEIAKAWTEAN